MRNLFALIGFAIVVFLGLGWYLGWYKLDWATKSDGTTSVHFDVNAKKVGGDLQNGAQKAEAFIEKLKSKSPAAEISKKQTEDPTFVGPPLPHDHVSPGTQQPAAGLPIPNGPEKGR
jgi:hypothetical protein